MVIQSPKQNRLGVYPQQQGGVCIPAQRPGGAPSSERKEGVSQGDVGHCGPCPPQPPMQLCPVVKALFLQGTILSPPHLMPRVLFPCWLSLSWCPSHWVSCPTEDP